MKYLNRNIYKASVLVIFALSNVAVASDFYVKEDDIAGPGYAIHINGKIQKGDMKEYISIVNRRSTFPDLIKISSPGGNVVEAVKIGRLVRKGHTKVLPVSTCNSSCALIVFGGTRNLQKGNIGLHRPYYDESYFSNLGRNEAEAQYDKLTEYMRSYMDEMDVPTVVADKMFTVSSGDIYKISMEQYRGLAGEYPPAYHEWLKAKCGMLKKGEREDLEKVFALKNYTRYQGWKDSELKRDLLREHEALAMKGMKFPEEYKDYLIKENKKFSQCKREAIEKDRKKLMSGMFVNDLSNTEPEFLLTE